MAAFVKVSVVLGSVAVVAGVLAMMKIAHPRTTRASNDEHRGNSERNDHANNGDDDGGGDGDDDNDNDDDNDAKTAVPIILHGRETASDPAVVKVQRHHGSGGLGVCTGTVIAPRYVLTARHCTGSGRLEVLVDDGGAHPHAHVKPTRIAVTRTHLDRATGRHQSSGDIAVLELAQATTVAPIPVNLDARAALAVREARAVGFGLTTSRVDDEKKRTVEFTSRTTSEFIESDRKGVVCYGDSGGPTLSMIDGREHLVAVTSHMTSTICSRGRARSVRTDRHAAFLQRFIDDKQLPPPVPTPQAKVDPVAPIPAPVPAPIPVPPVHPIPPAPLPPLPPLPPPTTGNAHAHAHAHASSSNGRTRVSVRVDGTGAHAEAHAD